ncbi:restriction endonuclease subunit S [Halorhodospira halochloris]|uniref:restriction endonuclease subunit S n=1 Tax=Halorhodospira halochloris TaxID=1052 RepID=UPI001EE7FA92|nr:restriction endonuclease subunit S [Halorhodospira halochloris]MCG5531516.1 restriction endonuclease subunit S [Halorhodospira halochloris]
MNSEVAALGPNEELRAGWKSLRIKYLLREVDNRTATGTEPLLSLRQGKGLVLHNDVSNKRFGTEDLLGYKIVRPGQLVMNRMRASIGLFAASRTHGLVSPDYAVFSPIRPVNLAYLVYLFQTPAMGVMFRVQSRGMGTGSSGFLRLYTDRFSEISIAIPSVEEQGHIVNYLRVAELKIARFIRNKRRLIELLKEQKQNIINQAVTRGLDPNVKLKPSGVEWIGDIPAHWELRRLKHLCRNVNRQTSEKTSDEVYVALEYVEAWTGRMSFPNEDVSFDSQVKRFEAGDVLFGKLRPYLAKVTKPNVCGVCVGEFLVLRPSLERVSGEYLEQKLRSRDVINVINRSTFGAKMPRADWTFIGNLKIAYPPKNEQQEILRHIQEQSVQIDETITRAEREIELIREYRTRLISDVVTGQVDVRGIEVPEVTEAELQALDDAPGEDEELVDDEATAEVAQ